MNLTTEQYERITGRKVPPVGKPDHFRDAAKMIPSPKPSKPRKWSKLEEEFICQWSRLGGPELEREVVFHPDRKWRFDFAHLASKVAIEIEGGVWSRGRHTRGKGFIEDCYKYNAAVRLGWRVFRLTSEHLKDSKNVQEIIDAIREVK